MTHIGYCQVGPENPKSGSESKIGYLEVELWRFKGQKSTFCFSRLSRLRMKSKFRFFSGNTTVGSKLDGQPYRSSLRCSMTEIWLMNHHIPLFGHFEIFQSIFLPVSTFKEPTSNKFVSQHIELNRPISGQFPVNCRSWPTHSTRQVQWIAVEFELGQKH